MMNNALRYTALLICAVGALGIQVEAMTRVVALIDAQSFDWEELTMVLMGFAGVAWMVMDHKRTTALEAFALHFTEELARMKTILGDNGPHTLVERVSALEAYSENSISTHGLSERLSCVEVKLDLIERLTVLEARADHVPVRVTKRKKDGKYASPAEPVVEELEEEPATSSTSRSPGTPAAGRARPSRS